jgi:antibiotic biosynthesis monooxygenase (ABM) superfamily enzyme
MRNMKTKKKGLPAPFAAPSKDARFEGTFEVLVPVPDRNRPHKVALQFDTLAAAEGWIHSPDGEDAIALILRAAAAAK